MDSKIKLLLIFFGIAIVLIMFTMSSIFSVSYLQFTTDNQVANSMVEASDKLGLFGNSETETAED